MGLKQVWKGSRVIQRRIRGVLVSWSRHHIMMGSHLLPVDVVHVPVLLFDTGSGGVGYSSAVSVYY